jgi:iron complex outermembrane receptor protein
MPEKAFMLKTTLIQRSLILLLMFIVSGSNLLYAQDTAQDREKEKSVPRFELDEIVVTATRIEEPIQNIPRNVTVITSEDIEQSPSNNIVDLLARESGVNLRSLFGTDKQAVVDIRGMGDTSVSNVVVMVDGIRLNPPDLAGPDFSSIPLDQIERIEIVRGAGSVIYGDGAVGGVINIITKRGEEEPEARVYTSYGSFDSFDGRASYRGRISDLSFTMNGDYYNSDGYRDNSSFRKKDIATKIGYDWGDYITLTLTGSHHEDRYGLPGPVSKEDVDSRERRILTDRPDDCGETSDRRMVGGVEIVLGHWGNITASRGYRFRDNSYIIGYSPLIPRDDQTDEIDEDTRSLTLGYNKDYEVLGLSHRFQCGIDHYETEYVREELSRGQRKNSEVENVGLFFNNHWSLTDDLLWEWGYRYNEYQGRFRTDIRRSFDGGRRWVNGDITEKKWIRNVYDVGLVYTFRPKTTFFASYAVSFRVPNVDEFARADDSLQPQKGQHVELGGRSRIGELAEFAVTLFHTGIENEIYFGEDPVTGESFNRNYDEKTIRHGVETDAKIYPTDSIYLWGNYCYTEAKFEVKETYIPLVPKHKASIGVEWNIFEPLVLSLTLTWVGSRFDGNDENNNRYERLDAYEVLDCKLTYKYDGLKIFAGVNNILDELYSTTAYSESYYPMPTRNIYGGVEWSF